MAEKTVNEILQQAISDFDAVEAAIEDSGVDVPYGTDTSEYGNLVRQAVALAASGTQYVGDQKSIIVEDNVIKIVGFEAAEVGAQPQKNADGGIDWIIPSADSVDGLQSIVAGLQTDVETLKTDYEALAEIVENLDNTNGIPVAGETLGLVKSSAGENKVAVDENGEMSVKQINVNTLVQTEGEELILIGGSSK